MADMMDPAMIESVIGTMKTMDKGSVAQMLMASGVVKSQDQVRMCRVNNRERGVGCVYQRAQRSSAA